MSTAMRARAVALACWLVVLAARGHPAVEPSGREKALARLHEVFGLPRRDGRTQRRHDVPPQFMVELYDAVAEPSGLTKGSSPYNAKVVRSFIERDNSKEQFFFFNISGLDHEEYVLEAELHIFRMRAPQGEEHRFFPSSPNCLLHVYQVVDELASSQPDLQRLLSVQYVSASGPGWLVVNVKQAVLDWLGGRSPNLGLLVVATSLFGEPVRLHVARRDHHHNSKQPILVLFDGDRRHPVLEDADVPRAHDAPASRSSPDAGRRARRSPPGDASSTPSGELQRPSVANSSTLECARRPLYVDFADIGWNSWICSPAGYMAYQCKGHCDFPLGQDQGPTNHATVQSIVHELKLQQDVGKPCCVPTELAAFSMLYVDDEKNVVLKNYEDMVAVSCGCH